MNVFEVICKVVGLVAGFLSIIDKIHTYCSRNEKDPSGSPTSDGSVRESEDS